MSDIAGVFQLNDVQLVNFIGDFLAIVQGGCKFSANFQCEAIPVNVNNQDGQDTPNELTIPEKVLTIWLPMCN